MPGASDVEEVARSYRLMARTLAHDQAPLYHRISAAVAQDADLLALMDHAPPTQRRPNLLLAAVHSLLLHGADHPLARWYPTVGVLGASGLFDSLAAGAGRAWSGTPKDPDDDGLSEDFASFCADYRPALVEMLATRATQTNEVGRCAVLLPGLATVARRHGRPLAVVDLGTSGGLNLLLDRYRYTYSDGQVAGHQTARVHLTCEVRAGRPPVQMPTIAARLGIDAQPVDVMVDDDALWLLACQWPDHLERFSQTLAAIATARTADRCPMVAGDMVDSLTSAVAGLPEAAHVCVVHSWAVAYLPPDRQRDLAGIIGALAQQRPLSWLYAEAAYEVPGIDVPDGPVAEVKGATAFVLHDVGNGAAPVRLADVHPHGRWVHWWAD